MSFAGLPVDALGVLSNFLEAHNVAALYLCGNHALNRKLMQGGAETFDLVFKSWKCAVLPPMISLLQGLRRLRVAFEPYVGFGDIYGFSWRMLPKTLTSLELRMIVDPCSLDDAPVPGAQRSLDSSWFGYDHLGVVDGRGVALDAEFPLMRHFKLVFQPPACAGKSNFWGKEDAFGWEPNFLRWMPNLETLVVLHRTVPELEYNNARDEPFSAALPSHHLIEPEQSQRGFKKTSWARTRLVLDVDKLPRGLKALEMNPHSIIHLRRPSDWPSGLVKLTLELKDEPLYGKQRGVRVKTYRKRGGGDSSKLGEKPLAPEEDGFESDDDDEVIILNPAQHASRMHVIPFPTHVQELSYSVWRELSRSSTSKTLDATPLFLALSNYRQLTAFDSPHIEYLDLPAMEALQAWLNQTGGRLRRLDLRRLNSLSPPSQSFPLLLPSSLTFLDFPIFTSADMPSIGARPAKQDHHHQQDQVHHPPLDSSSGQTTPEIPPPSSSSPSSSSSGLRVLPPNLLRLFSTKKGPSSQYSLTKALTPEEERDLNIEITHEKEMQRHILKDSTMLPKPFLSPELVGGSISRKSLLPSSLIAFVPSLTYAMIMPGYLPSQLFKGLHNLTYLRLVGDLRLESLVETLPLLLSLSHLFIHSSELSTRLLFAVDVQLPPSLAYLEHNGRASLVEKDAKEEDVPSTRHFHRLPRSLKTLVLQASLSHRCGDFGDAAYEAETTSTLHHPHHHPVLDLPPNLTVLSVHHLPPSASPYQWISFLPTSLTELYFSTSGFPSALSDDGSFSFSPSSSSSSSSSFDTLLSSKILPRDAFKDLSRLRKLSRLHMALRLPSKAGLFASTIQSLPNSLLELELRQVLPGKGSFPPEFDTTAFVEDTLLTDLDMVFLPRGLYGIDLPTSSALTMGCSIYMPPRLISLKIGGVDRATWRNPARLDLPFRGSLPLSCAFVRGGCDCHRQ